MWSPQRPTSFFHNELRDRLHITAVFPLVDDQKLWLAVELEPLLDPILGIGLCQRCDQGQGRGECLRFFRRPEK